MADFGKDIVKIGYIDDASINVDVLSAYSYPEDSPVGKWLVIHVFKFYLGLCEYFVFQSVKSLV